MFVEIFFTIFVLIFFPGESMIRFEFDSKKFVKNSVRNSSKLIQIKFKLDLIRSK